MQIRDFTEADFAATTALWTQCGLHPSSTETPASLAGVARLNPGLFLLGFEGGNLVATVLASWEGRRGWINRLAVAPSHRGRGLGREMLALAETRLAARGCHKVNLHVAPDNAGVQDYYEKCGFAEKKLIFMEKFL
jgi:ribosomal protein S18 acetylase RimI-like enzyme